MVRLAAPLVLAAALGSCSSGIDATLPSATGAVAALLPEPVEAAVPVVHVVAGRPDTLAVRDLLGVEAYARFGRDPDVTVQPVGTDSVVVYARPRFAGLAVIPFAVSGADYELAVQSVIHPEVTFTYRPEGAPSPEVAVVGTFNGWAPEPLTDADGDGTLEWAVVLTPGEYAYRFVVDGNETLDPSAVATVADTSGALSSALVVPPAVPGRLHLRLVGPEEDDPSILRLAVHRLGADGEDALVDIDEETGVVAFADNRLVNDNAIDADFGDVGLDLDAVGPSARRLRVAVRTDDGLVSNWVEVPLLGGRLANP